MSDLTRKEKKEACDKLEQAIARMRSYGMDVESIYKPYIEAGNKLLKIARQELESHK